MNWTPEKIEALRTHLGLSQAAFARLIGVGRCAVNRWKNKGIDPSPLACDALDRLAKRTK